MTVKSLDAYIRDGDAMVPVNKSAGVPCGTILPFAGDGDIPVGFLLCDGGSYSRVTFAALFAVIGTTYGALDDDHFNVPDLRDKFIEGSSAAGVVKEPGLPNITGNFAYSVSGGDDTTNGVFSKTFTSDYGTTVSLNGNVKVIQNNFNAARSSAIYGKSSTVQPPALTMRYVIKAFGGASESSTDLAITNVANDLGTLAADAAVVAKGNTYVRYANGLQICWGGGATVNGAEISFPVAFSFNPCVVMNFDGTVDTGACVCPKVRGKAGFSVYSTYGAITVACVWYAIGRWK